MSTIDTNTNNNGNKLIKHSRRDRTLHVRIDSETLDYVRSIAVDEDLTVSDICRRAIKMYCKKMRA